MANNPIRTLADLAIERPIPLPFLATDLLMVERDGRTYIGTILDLIANVPPIGLVPNTRQVAGHPLSADVIVSKGDVGLGNVDNTADVNKPVSTAQATADALRLLISNNLSELTNLATARSNLGLGNVATRAVGTTAGTAAAGDDSRIVGAAQKASNLSDLASAVSARANLGLRWTPAQLSSWNAVATAQAALTGIPSTAKLVLIIGHAQLSAQNQQIIGQFSSDNGSTWLNTGYYYGDIKGDGATASSTSSTGNTTMFLSDVGDTVVPNLVIILIAKGAAWTAWMSITTSWWNLNSRRTAAIKNGMINNVAWNAIRLFGSSSATLDTARFDWSYLDG